MSDSPYAPPRAAVADAEPAWDALPRPARVLTALRLQWAAWTIDLLSSLWLVFSANWIRSAFIGGIIGTVVFSALYAWFYRVTARGGGWARWAGATFFVLTLLISLLFPDPPHADGGGPGMAEKSANILGWLTAAVQVYAYVLLFTGSAAEWFRAMNGRR